MTKSVSKELIDEIQSWGKDTLRANFLALVEDAILKEVELADLKKELADVKEKYREKESGIIVIP